MAHGGDLKEPLVFIEVKDWTLDEICGWLERVKCHGFLNFHPSL